MNKMDIVKKYTNLMLTRRGYTSINYTEIDAAGSKPRFTALKPNREKVIIFFINTVDKTEKVTINIVKSIISIAKDITHIIIVHNTVLTSDAKQNITNSTDETISLYQFETFTFDELSYDLFEVLYEDIDDKTNIQIKQHYSFVNKQKLSILHSTDPIARYLRIRHGDIVVGRFGNNMISIRRCIIPS
jgi:hypothetical protein